MDYFSLPRFILTILWAMTGFTLFVLFMSIFHDVDELEVGKVCVPAALFIGLSIVLF